MPIRNSKIPVAPKKPKVELKITQKPRTMITQKTKVSIRPPLKKQITIESIVSPKPKKATVSNQ